MLGGLDVEAPRTAYEIQPAYTETGEGQRDERGFERGRDGSGVIRGGLEGWLGKGGSKGRSVWM